MAPPDQRSPADGATLDEIFRCLSHPTRRRILTRLAEHNPRHEDEFSTRGFDPDDRELTMFKTRIHHKHLPLLEKSGFLEWDREADVITRGPNFEEVRPLIDLMVNHQDELPEGWP